MVKHSVAFNKSLYQIVKCSMQIKFKNCDVKVGRLISNATPGSITYSPTEMKMRF